MVGDSLAYSLGLGLMDNEQHYGVEGANAGILGCAFPPASSNAGGAWQSAIGRMPDGTRPVVAQCEPSSVPVP